MYKAGIMLAAAAFAVVFIGAAIVAPSQPEGDQRGDTQARAGSITGCTDSAKDAISELRLLPDEEANTEVSPDNEGDTCIAYYPSKSTRPNAVNHYREQLQSHGRKIDRMVAGAAAELPKGDTWMQAVRDDMCFVVLIAKSEDPKAPTAVNLTIGPLEVVCA